MIRIKIQWNATKMTRIIAKHTHHYKNLGIIQQIQSWVAWDSTFPKKSCSLCVSKLLVIWVNIKSYTNPRISRMCKYCCLTEFCEIRSSATRIKKCSENFVRSLATSRCHVTETTSQWYVTTALTWPGLVLLTILSHTRIIHKRNIKSSYIEKETQELLLVGNRIHAWTEPNKFYPSFASTWGIRSTLSLELGADADPSANSSSLVYFNLWSSLR